MLSMAMLGAPKYKHSWVVTPTQAATRPIIHPCPGAFAAIDITNSAAGTVDTLGPDPIYVPALGFYGYAHIIGRVGNVRAMLNVWVVPDTTPKWCDTDVSLRFARNEDEYLKDQYLHPRRGAFEWDRSLSWLSYDSSDFATPVRKSITVTPNVGLHHLDGSVVGGGSDPHSFFVLYYSNYGAWTDITSTCTVLSITSTTVSFDVPGLNASDFTILATDQWDCWMVGAQIYE